MSPRAQQVLQWCDLDVQTRIRRGAFGDMSRAVCAGQQVIVKCFDATDRKFSDATRSAVEASEVLCGFRRELYALRNLKHPGIVTYVGCVLHHSERAVVTEYLPYGDVFELFYVYRVNVSADIRLTMARQIACAINYMHSRTLPVAHLDLKTQSILLDSEYTAKLCDFHMARPVHEGTTALGCQEALGPVRYLSPELLSGPGAALSEKADLWSFGCCLVEMMGGPIPYEGLLQAARIVDCINRRESPMVPPWFVPAIREVIQQCFDFEAYLRPSAAQVAECLDATTPEELEQHGMDRRRQS